jgi:glycosylphosphatidylinositol transamidase (GPIT) subunit GPI8
MIIDYKFNKIIVGDRDTKIIMTVYEGEYCDIEEYFPGIGIKIVNRYVRNKVLYKKDIDIKNKLNKAEIINIANEEISSNSTREVILEQIKSKV